MYGKLLRIGIALALFGSLAFGQTPKGLERYGSVARQQTVLQNIRRQEHAERLREYRLFRAEIRRQTPRQSFVVVRSMSYRPLPYRRAVPVRID